MDDETNSKCTISRDLYLIWPLVAVSNNKYSEATRV